MDQKVAGSIPAAPIIEVAPSFSGEDPRLSIWRREFNSLWGDQNKSPQNMIYFFRKLWTVIMIYMFDMVCTVRWVEKIQYYRVRVQKRNYPCVWRVERFTAHCKSSGEIADCMKRVLQSWKEGKRDK